MKIQPRQIEQFVKAPDKAARVILIYGPDQGLVKERARAIGLGIVSDLNDPFNAVTLSTAQIADDPARLSDEANAMSMMGGDRLIRIEDAGDKLTAYIKDYLSAASEQSLIVLEAGELNPRSSLRKLCEQAPNAAALACYVDDERDVGALIRSSLQEQNMRIEHDAVQWLAASIAGNRARVRSEIDKLVTYMGTQESTVTLPHVQACCGQAGDQSLDNLAYQVAGRKTAEALKTYNTLLEEGISPIAMLRVLQNHFRRLHFSRSQMQAGQNVEQAMKGLAPPVFFKQAPLFKAQLQQWSIKSLLLALSRLSQLEAQCKTTGTPSETLCAQAILSLAGSRKG